jgi:bifunctional non-homologous end joining protein LigD
LAVHVEDHPLEYVDFEDVIPPGNYGAGPMIVWDRGDWWALEDPEAGLEDGKLLFELRGFKLRGVWTLVKLRNTESDWLLMREKRTLSRAELEAAPGADATVPPQSILSGLTVAELGAGLDRGPALAERAAGAGAPRRSVRAERVKLMLAHTAEGPFTDPEWWFELKLDGYRMLGGRNGSVARLITRNGNDATSWFPELARAFKALPVDDFVVDGEVVMHDEAGRPSFQRLQRRARVRRPMDVKRASLRQPATFYAFDLLGVAGHDLRTLPLRSRKELLRDLLPPGGRLPGVSRPCRHRIHGIRPAGHARSARPAGDSRAGCRGGHRRGRRSLGGGSHRRRSPLSRANRGRSPPSTGVREAAG